MSNSCCIGYGTVGRATAEAFGIKKYYSRSNLNMTLEEASQCKFIFICMPTPTIKGENFVDDILDIILKINDYPDTNGRIFIIRSTVLPGFNRLLQKYGIKAVSNPEFLSEDTAVKDANNPDLIVLGGDDMESLNAVKALYVGRFKTQDIVMTNSVTAELIKYTLNSFFATKVIFANEIYDLAQEVRANYETIKGVLEKHKWGSINHFTIEYKGKRGVHGKCLPKDIKALAHITGSEFFNTLVQLNRRFEDE